jgi:hypothetical protein
VDYAWDLCDCKERKQFEFTNADASDRSVDPAISTVNSRVPLARGMFVLAAREPIGQSGVTRWAVRVDHNLQWCVAFGVTQHTPAEVNERLAGCTVSHSDEKSYSVATCSIESFSHQHTIHTPSKEKIAKSPGLKSGDFRMGTVYFRADLVANILTIVMARDGGGAATSSSCSSGATDRAVGKGGVAQEWCRLQIHIPELASYYQHCMLMPPEVRISFPDPELRAPDEQ